MTGAQPQLFCFIPALHGIVSGSTTDVHSSNGYTWSSIADIANEATGLKLAVQTARASIALLPDIAKTIEEQEAEITELEKELSG